ncbi:MAG: hypothetical protein HXY40_08445 [Chloroflexi bacterium]|nr:hypothetical protein [Chloroflexota bacterium]
MNTSSHDENEQRLRAMLIEDTGSEAQAETLLATVKRLRAWRPPESAPSAALLARLAAELPRRLSRRERLSLWLGSVPALLLLRSQVRIVRGGLLLASAFSLALGVPVTLLLTLPGNTTPLVLLAPLVAALGIAFIYGEESDPPMEVLLTLPLTPRLVLLARMALVFGADLLLAAAASLALALLSAQWSFGALLTLWLAPMTFLSALALFTSTLSRDALSGVALSLFVWFALCAGHLLAAADTPTWLPDVFGGAFQPQLFGLALALVSGALWLVGQESHWLKREQG